MSEGMKGVALKQHPMRPGSGHVVKTAATQGGVWASAAFSGPRVARSGRARLEGPWAGAPLPCSF